MNPNSQVNRAELLHWIAQCNNDDEALQLTAELLGYQFPQSRLPDKAKPLASPEPQVDSVEPTDLIENAEQPKIPKVSFHYLANRERYASEAEASQERPSLFENTQAISDAELDNYWQTHTPLKRSPITNKPRMSAFLRDQLRQSLAKRIDIKPLIKRIAKQQPLNEIPRQTRFLPAGRVTVIADLNPRILPFWNDVRDVCELIKQKQGEIGLDIRVLAKGEPQNSIYRYDDWCNNKLYRLPWQKIPAQSKVFIISDLGQLAPKESLIRQCWLGFIRALTRRGIQAIVLAPIAAERQCPKLQTLTQLILWQYAGNVRPCKSRGDPSTYQARLRRIISYLSLSPHIEPVLLRAICKILPRQEANSGFEADIYLHSDIQWSYASISIQSDKRESYQQLFKQEDPEIQQQVLQLIRQHHSNQFPSVWAETVLNAEALMPIDESLITQAEQLMLRFVTRYYGEQEHEGMAQFARRHLSRLQIKQRSNKSYASAFYGLAYRQAINAGEEIPSEYNKQIVSQLFKRLNERKTYQIRQQGERLFIAERQRETTSVEFNVIYGKKLATFDSVQNTVLLNQQLLKLPSLSLKQTQIELNVSSQERLMVDTGQERLCISRLQKPNWAEAIGYDEKGFYLAYRQHRLDYPTWAENIGVDEYGLFADVFVNSVTQRFRGILSGNFMMGSPESEAGRYNDEDCHHVTLSQGYWLADTACTQVLWQAVMGANPANFTNNSQNPIENVSWLGVQSFLEKLNQLSPNLKAQLPSEAQWEYACRAGTQTAFSFEGEINVKKVNYRGTWDDSDKWGEGAKQKTAPVKSYINNAWGLYEMHGNIWEWCLDEWSENLGKESVFDPINTSNKSDDGASVNRVLRGGSWLHNGRNCRSAIRYYNSAGYRNWHFGFRLSLGHELQPRTDSNSGQTEYVPARRGAVQGHGQAGSGVLAGAKKVMSKK